MKVIESMPREELLEHALELGGLPGFKHRPEMQSKKLLKLLDDSELLNLVLEAVEEFKAAFR